MMDERLIYSLSEQILHLLPDDNIMALAILSVCLEQHCLNIGIGSKDAWKMLNEVSKQVHEDYGEYGEERC